MNISHFKLYFKSLIIIVVSFSGLLLNAQSIQLKQGDAKLEVKQNSYTELQFANTLTQFKYTTVKTEKGNFIQLDVPDYGSSNRIGDPKLPMLRKLIEIPIGATPSVKVTNYTVTDYKLSDYGITYPVLSAQPSVSKAPTKPKPKFQYNEITYSSNQFNSDELVTVDVLGIMRGVRLARLNIAPVQYNPVTNTIRVYNDIEVDCFSRS